MEFFTKLSSLDILLDVAVKYYTIVFVHSELFYEGHVIRAAYPHLSLFILITTIYALIELARTGKTCP